MKITIIGASGYVGQNLAYTLGEEGFHVTGIVRKKNAGLLTHTNLIYRETHHKLFDESIIDRDYVIHADHPRNHIISVGSIYSYFENIIKPTCELVDYLNDKKRKLIFISSGGSIYGNNKKPSFSENDTPSPISTYGITKLTIENYIKFVSNSRGLNYIILRPSNIYGFSKKYLGKIATNGFINSSIEKFFNHQTIKIFGKNGMIRDYIHMQDFVNSIVNLVKSNQNMETFNVSTNIGFNNLEIINMLSEITQNNFKFTFADERYFDSKSSILENQKIRNATNWKQNISIEAGLKLTYDFLTQYGKK